MAYLSSKVEDSESERETYWRRDVTSVDAYLETIEPFRTNFQAFLGVPDECVGAEAPVITSLAAVDNDTGAELQAWELAVCGGALSSFSLVGIPAGPPPYPTVVAVHGTCGSPERLMGLQGDDYHHEFGRRLVDAGFMVVAPLITTRPTVAGADCESPTNESRNQLDRRALPLGDRLVGVEVGKLMELARHLENLGVTELAIYGISLGGLLAFSAGAVDRRFDAVVVSNWIEDRSRKLVDSDDPFAYWRYEDADYVIFADQLGLFTDVDIGSLIAPRWLFVEVGAADPRAKTAPAVVAEIAEFWAQLDLPADHVGIAVEDGGHEVFLSESLAFLERWLTAAS
jgi:hypothetical protein